MQYMISGTVESLCHFKERRYSKTPLWYAMTAEYTSKGIKLLSLPNPDDTTTIARIHHRNSALSLLELSMQSHVKVFERTKTISKTSNPCILCEYRTPTLQLYPVFINFTIRNDGKKLPVNKSERILVRKHLNQHRSRLIRISRLRKIILYFLPLFSIRLFASEYSITRTNR